MNSDQELKTVRVGNWESLFFNKLRSLFDRAEFCDLTLQFYDNSILKVHRVVLSACTDYFNMLELSCEMVEDTLILPYDLPANVIVPIVNFMYTGTLKFHNQLFEKLLKTSQEMKLSVLSKLLEFHRPAEVEEIIKPTQKLRQTNLLVARPKARYVQLPTPPPHLVSRSPSKLVKRYSKPTEPTTDPLAIPKIEKPPTSNIRILDNRERTARPPKRTWDARVEHHPKQLMLPRPPIPVRNSMAKRMTYPKHDRHVRPVKPIAQESNTNDFKVEPADNRTSITMETEAACIDQDPLSISLAQETDDECSTEFRELPFKIESVRTMQPGQAPKRPAPIETHQEELKRVKNEENVLEISDDSFDDNDFLLSLKDFDGVNVENN